MKTILLLSALTLMNVHFAEASFPSRSLLVCSGPSGLKLDLYGGGRIGKPDLLGNTKQAGVLNISSPMLSVEDEHVIIANTDWSTRCGAKDLTQAKFSGGQFDITQVTNNACGQQHYTTYFLYVNQSDGSQKPVPLDCQWEQQ